MKNNVGVVIAAAGNSSRMNGRNKLLEVVGGMPVIARACSAFEKNYNVSEIVVVTKPENAATVRDILDGYDISKLKDVVFGSATRAESVKNGVAALSKCDYVAVHDGARPFVSKELMDRCFETAFERGSAVPVLSSTDTLKKVEGGEVTCTVDREKVYRVQTPQVFEYGAFMRALDKYADGTYTDDCAMMEAAGEKIAACVGERENIKLTTPYDMELAKFIAGSEEKMPRAGFGYDVHRLVDGRRLVLCGVDIPFEKGLLGHSDADVAVHAACDALLGAAALGDIGKLFPDNDEKYAGADSIKLLEKVAEIVNAIGFTIGNIDITIIAQAPKLSPYTEEMRENIASACGCNVSDISVKATTEEGLGFTGSREGIFAAAVCTLI